MSTSAEAGPSTLKEVPLSVEPVHIYTDSSPHASAFERELTLQDVLSDGTNVFATRKAASTQLSEDVRRLWSERGDFSRFRTDELVRKRSRPDANPLPDSDDEEVEGKAEEEGKKEEGLLRKTDERVGGTITETEFIEMRNRALGSLDVAHFNSIHAHQLLGMLLKQHRSAPSAGAAARMGSPAPSVGGQSSRSASTIAPKQAPLGIFSHLQSGNREEEFVLDPLAIALSRTSLNSSIAVRRLASEEQDEEEEDEYDADPTNPEYAVKQARREMESAPGFKENQLREFKVVLETKRRAIANAAELLSDAAGELRRSQAGNRERWRGLIGLHGRGWGLTPGRPLLDVERFGVSAGDDEEEDASNGKDRPETSTKGGDEGKKPASKKDEGKKTAAGLQGFGTPIVTSDGKVKEEGARDAWIGFGLPEAPVELKRRSIAYWADLPTSPTAGLTADEIKQKLVFPDRMHRRLRVRFVLWPSPTLTTERMEWSSDPPPSPTSNPELVIAGQILDEELQQASREATDELIFGDVVAQARQLPPAFGVRLTSSAVRIVLTKRLDLVIELVPASNSPEADAGSEMVYAPYAALLLAFLRLGPLRKYQAFVRATEQGRRSDAAARAAGVKAGAMAVPKKTGGGKVDGGGKVGGKASSGAMGRLESVGPVVIGLHYWSFVHRLGSVLRVVQAKSLDKGLKVKVQLVPVTAGSGCSLGQLTRSLGSLVDATPSLPYPRESREKASTSLDALHGHAKVLVDADGSQRLVCTLTFSQPSLLSVQFAATPKSRLTTKPLAVDIDTLRGLLVQQLAHYS